MQQVIASGASNTDGGGGAEEDVAALTVFLRSCGLGVVASKKLGQLLVTRHNIASVAKLRKLSVSGKLANILSVAGMDTDDVDLVLTSTGGNKDASKLSDGAVSGTYFDRIRY